MKNLLRYLLVLLVVFSCKEQQQEAELVLDTKSKLGEGAIWNYRTGELMWVDIKGKILNFYNPITENNKEMFTGQLVGSVVPGESGNALIALQNGIYSFDVTSGSKKFIADPEEHLPDNRFNDGKCDPAGRFWAGTMSMVGSSNAGTLYRLDPDRSIHSMVDNVSISNGIVWTADKTKMYYIDTPTQKVMGYDYNDVTGELSNPEVAIEIDNEMGAPDGMSIDEQGKLWIALWGGYAVGCWDPETGGLLRKVKVPAKNVTSCAFGDQDLGTLYITTAREGNSEEELVEFPHSGGLFKIRPGVKGVQAFFFNDNN